MPKWHLPNCITVSLPAIIFSHFIKKNLEAGDDKKTPEFRAFQIHQENKT
jgi:hypothetical protein